MASGFTTLALLPQTLETSPVGFLMVINCEQLITMSLLPLLGPKG